MLFKESKSAKDKDSIDTTASLEGQLTVELECLKEEETNVDDTTEVEVRRSARTKKAPDYYGVRVYIADTDTDTNVGNWSSKTKN